MQRQETLEQHIERTSYGILKLTEQLKHGDRLHDATYTLRYLHGAKYDLDTVNGLQLRENPGVQVRVCVGDFQEYVCVPLSFGLRPSLRSPYCRLWIEAGTVTPEPTALFNLSLIQSRINYNDFAVRIYANDKPIVTIAQAYVSVLSKRISRDWCRLIFGGVWLERCLLQNDIDAIDLNVKRAEAAKTHGVDISKLAEWE